MRIILTTLMFSFSLVGLAFAAYEKNWEVFLLSPPFSLQFAGLMYLANQRYVKMQKALKKSLVENKKLKDLLRKGGAE